MNSSERSWRHAIIERFPLRETYSADVAYEQAWGGTNVPPGEVAAVLELLELEYSIAPGFFRPDDSLDWLLERVDGGGFWTRSVNEVRAGDRQLELGSYLERRCKDHGVPMPSDLATLGEYIRACAGLRAI